MPSAPLLDLDLIAPTLPVGDPGTRKWQAQQEPRWEMGQGSTVVMSQSPL